MDLAFEGGVIAGNGGGTFAPSVRIPIEVSYNDFMNIADVNSDGMSDFLVTKSLNNAFFSILGNANSLFKSNIGNPTARNASTICSGDINNDGKEDVLIASYNEIFVYENTGNGYVNVVSYTTTSTCTDLSIADYNGDGKMDFAALFPNDQKAVIFYRNGLGFFSSPTTFSVGVYPRHILSPDINNDGISDLVCSNHQSQGFTVFLGQNTGLIYSSTTNCFSISPEVMTFSDFNGDGKKDMVCTDDNSHSFYLFPGDGLGGFSAPTTIGSVSNAPSWVEVGDLNSDGFPDLVYSNYSTMSVYINNGSGSFLNLVNYNSTETYYQLKLSDMNGDGKLDVILKQGKNIIEIRFGNGNGTFSPATKYQIYSELSSFVISDFNADGVNDIITTHPQNDAFVVLSNQSAHILNITGSSICQSGQSVTLKGTKNANSYLWQPSGNTADSLVVTSAGVYSLTTGNNVGCLSTATINVGTAPMLVLTSSSPSFSVCAGPPITLNISGANTYTWSNGLTAASISVMPSVTTIYSVTGNDINNCTGVQSVTISVDSSCYVWPGDANSDGTADNLDVLELGLHYAQTGTQRASISNTWQSYFANNWTGTITNGKNLNHSDCNGDGIINDNDTLTIYNNYGLTHSFKPAQTNTVNPQLSIVPDQAAVTKGSWGTASVYLGEASTNINNINGVAFTVDFDNTLIETNSIYIEYQNSFLDAGQNLDFRKLDFANAKIFTATTHTLNNNVSGFGKIATLHYQIKSTLTTDQILNLGISQANQSDASGTITPLTSGTGTLMAIGASVGLQELNNNFISISPNPTNGSLTINSKTELQKIEVVSITGQVLLSEISTNVSHTLHLDNFANGIYFVNVYQNARVVKREKIVLNK